MTSANRIVVIDNFLEPTSFKILQKLLMGTDFFWTLEEKVPWHNRQPELGEWSHKKGEIAKYNYQMVRKLYSHHLGSSQPMDKYYDELEPLLSALDIFSLLRLRATFNHRTEAPLLLGAYHTDFDPKYSEINAYTAVFYLNTNNGYTSFLSGEKVESVENRIALFPCDLMHAAVSCTDQQYRVQININFIHDPVIR